MNIQLAVSGKRNTDKSNFMEWLVTQLTTMGADVTVLSGDSISVVADKGFLANTNKVCAQNTIEPDLLREAHQIIHNDREGTYGDPGRNLRTIAQYWNTHIQAAKSVSAGLTPDDVAGMMILLKQARLANNPKHRDSLVDIAGYAGLQDRIHQSSNSANGQVKECTLGELQKMEAAQYRSK